MNTVVGYCKSSNRDYLCKNAFSCTITSQSKFGDIDWPPSVFKSRFC